MKTKITLTLLLLLSQFLFASTAGDLNPSFASGGKYALSPSNHTDVLQKTFLQTDGKILVLGTMSTGGPNNFQAYISRLNADGTPDVNFGYGASSTLFAASQTEGTLPRYVAVGANGKIVIAGMVTAPDMDLFVVQLNSDGTFDTTFNGTGLLVIQNTNSYDETAAGLAVRSDGKIIIAENASVNTVPYLILTRLNANGTFDYTYGVFSTLIFSLAGKAVNVREIVNDEINDRIYAIGGLQNLSPPEEYPFVAAFNHAGPDSTFGYYGFNTINSTHSGCNASAGIWKNNNGFAIAMASAATGESYLYHFNSQGLADNSYTTTHLPNAYIESLTQQPNGQIVYGGKKLFSVYKSAMVVGRLQYYGLPDSTFGKIGYVNYIFNNDSIESAVAVHVTTVGNILGGTTYKENSTEEDYMLFELIPENISEIRFQAFSSSFGNTPAGTASNSQATVIHAEWTTSPITVTATAEFEISKNNSNWSQSFILNQSDFDTSATQHVNFFFRFHPNSMGNKSGFIYNECPGMVSDWNDTIRLSGTSIPSVDIRETENEISLAVYPNPVNRYLIIETFTETTETELLILNLLGEEVLKTKTENNRTAIDVSSLLSGVYFMRLGNTIRKFHKL